MVPRLQYGHIGEIVFPGFTPSSRIWRHLCAYEEGNGSIPVPLLTESESTQSFNLLLSERKDMPDEHDRFESVPPDAGVDGYEPSFVEVNGIRTRYYDVGSGEPLILVHGGNWGGHWSANDWTRTFEHLQDRFRVLAFDRVGCGLTDHPDDPRDFRFGTDLEHALGFVDALDVDAAHLSGFSRGAGLATRMAVQKPDRFNTLILTNSVTLGPPVGDDSYRHRRLFDMEELGLDPADPAYYRRRHEQYAYDSAYVTDDRVTAAASMAARENATRTRRIMDKGGEIENWTQSLQEHMSHTRRRVRQGTLSMPVLYLYGRNDLTMPTEMAMSGMEVFSQGDTEIRLTVLDDCGHMIFLEHPAEFARLLRDFVDFWHGT